MAKTKLSTFLRSMVLVLLLVSWVSLKTIVKDGNFPVSTNEVKDVSSTEWLQPTGDEANKRVSRSAPGSVYIIGMHECHGHTAGPFVKIGRSGNCEDRIRALQVANPYRLICHRTFIVTSMSAAEHQAHVTMSQHKLNCSGGSEWFHTFGHRDSFIERVRDAIRPYLQGGQEEPESERGSESESERGSESESERGSESESERGSESESERGSESESEDHGLVVSSINRAPNQAATKMATNYGHNNTKWRQDLEGKMLHVKYNCK